MKVSVLFARFPFGGSEHPAGTNWLIKTVLLAKNDHRISDVMHMDVDDTPITMSRNRVLKAAQQQKADIVCMLDSDMAPDLPIQGAVPFWGSSLSFMLAHKGPCVVAAPYCGPPPHENVYVFRWDQKQSENPNVDLGLEQYSREEALGRAGFEEVAALPTGLCLIDVRALDFLKGTWFDYEYEDPPFNTRKATTEDVFFTRNLSLAGVPQYANWSAWAGHIKRKIVGKPCKLTVEQVREQFRDAVATGRTNKEKLVMIGEGGVNFSSGSGSGYSVLEDHEI